MKKIDNLITSDIIQRYYYDEIHEFLVAIDEYKAYVTEYDDDNLFANVPIVGYIDLDTNKRSENIGTIQFELMSEDLEKDAFYHYFNKYKIYRIKGMLPEAFGDENIDSCYRMSGLYVTEIVSENEENDFLQGLIEDAKREIALDSEVLGKLTFFKNFQWYDGKSIWGDKNVIVSIAANRIQKDMSSDLAIAENFFLNQAEWDRKIREYAAEQLTDKANRYWRRNDIEQRKMITKEDFARRMRIDNICFAEDGEFKIYCDDDRMLLEKAIVVSGDVENGLNNICVIDNYF